MADDVTTIRALVIDDAKTLRLAEELAALRHMSVQDVVADAVLTRLERERVIHEKTKRILEAAAAVRETLLPPLPSSDHSWLYDEDGLPA